MPSRRQAIQVLLSNGHAGLADELSGWTNVQGTAGGWDAWLKRAHPQAAELVWGGNATHGAPKPRAIATTTTHLAMPEHLSLQTGRQADFDIYWIVDWSARNEPCSGKDRLWAARLWWDNGEARLRADNYSTRAAFEAEARRALSQEFAEARVLLGFDFPFGYPRGFARALGAGEPSWWSTWEAIASRVVDTPGNASNRFDVAAELNRLVTGRLGPFYGVPRKLVASYAERLSPRAEGFFTFPLETLSGAALAQQRAVDHRARTVSSPWFLFGGANSVGSQALTGIPVVYRLRKSLQTARVWPFETGPRLPPREEARVVLCEVYPSLGFTADATDAAVRDEQQVRTTAQRFAALDASAQLSPLFSAPAGHEAALVEEGWILGCQ
jgi:hypothetical protein